MSVNNNDDTPGKQNKKKKFPIYFVKNVGSIYFRLPEYALVLKPAAVLGCIRSGIVIMVGLVLCRMEILKHGVAETR